MTAIYGDFYKFPEKLISPRRYGYVNEKTAAYKQVGISYCTTDRLWGSTQRCRDSLEGVNEL